MSRKGDGGLDAHAMEDNGELHFGVCGGGALPVIMSITGPREPHDYRGYDLWVLGTT